MEEQHGEEEGGSEPPRLHFSKLGGGRLLNDLKGWQIWVSEWRADFSLVQFADNIPPRAPDTPRALPKRSYSLHLPPHPSLQAARGRGTRRLGQTHRHQRSMLLRNPAKLAGLCLLASLLRALAAGSCPFAAESLGQAPSNEIDTAPPSAGDWAPPQLSGPSNVRAPAPQAAPRCRRVAAHQGSHCCQLPCLPARARA